MKRTTATPPLKFAAKLLFQFRVVTDGKSNVMRTCEERIVVLHAPTARAALALAKKRGKSAQHRYKNGAGGSVLFEFVGLVDLLHLGVECDDDEVWYDIAQRKLPMERAAKILPKESQLNALRNAR